jgi:hypothetical protein
LGGISREFSSIPVTRRRYPDDEQRNRDAQFAPKNGQKPSRAGPAYTSSAQERAETIPRGGIVFFNLKTWGGVLKRASVSRSSGEWNDAK